MLKQFITYNVKQVSLKELLLHYFGLSTQRRRIVKEMIKELNTEQVSISLSKEDLPTINQVFEEVAKKYDKPLAVEKKSHWLISSRLRTTTRII